MTAKKTALLIGLILSIYSFGQQLTYKGHLVDTLKISSNISRYHFDDRGTTTGTHDEYIIVFSKEKHCYVLNPYQRTNYKTTYRPDTFFVKEKILDRNLVIKQDLVSNLLKQFEAPSVKPTFDNLGMNQEKFLKLTHKKQILKVAKWYKANWYFKRKYSSKEENEEAFRGCQQVDTFNLYLATAFNSGYVIITDVDDSFEVQITTSKGAYRFEGKYPNPFKQPWYNHSACDSLYAEPLLNFSINAAILDILPDHFSRRETLLVDTLIDKYIEWYLKRREIIT